jgi:N-acetyl sugar amidotransferase
MEYCKQCLDTNTNPGAILDDGVCLPCTYNSASDITDWSKRKQELHEICDWAKVNTNTPYDCIIPVSGGKDSTRQALYMRDEMGMNPLLVSCAYPPEQQTERGAYNMANLIKLGFDAHIISPSPQTWKQLVKFCFYRYGNIFKSCELALFSSAPKLALAYSIPLLVYGENAALQWGGKVTSRDGDAMKLKYSNTLQGGDISIYLKTGFDMEKLYWYRYPNDEVLEKCDMKSVYLGYYIPDFDDETNARIAIDNGLMVRVGQDADPEQTGSFTNYDALDDDFVIVNQMLKYFKFGFGKASQQLSGFIRTGKITRKDAIEMLKKSDGHCAPRFIKKFCDFIEISENEFWAHADSLRDSDIWFLNENGWQMRKPIS